VAELVEHPRLWSFMPPGCEEHWLAAARPRMQALLEAQLGAEAPDVRARGLAIDAILSLPAHSLVRVRGGVRRVQGAMRTRLRTVASAGRSGDALPPAPVFPSRLTALNKPAGPPSWRTPKNLASGATCGAAWLR
jgi:hypothetical protein